MEDNFPRKLKLKVSRNILLERLQVKTSQKRWRQNILKGNHPSKKYAMMVCLCLNFSVHVCMHVHIYVYMCIHA